MTAELKLEEVTQDVASGWAIFQLKRLEASVTIAPKNYESRKITAEFEVPEAQPLRVAIPLFPGAGTQPDNTVTLTNVQDQVQLMIQELENAVLETIKTKQGDF